MGRFSLLAACALVACETTGVVLSQQQKDATAPTVAHVRIVNAQNQSVTVCLDRGTSVERIASLTAFSGSSYVETSGGVAAVRAIAGDSCDGMRAAADLQSIAVHDFMTISVAGALDDADIPPRIALALDDESSGSVVRLVNVAVPAAALEMVTLNDAGLSQSITFGQVSFGPNVDARGYVPTNDPVVRIQLSQLSPFASKFLDLSRAGTLSIYVFKAPGNLSPGWTALLCGDGALDGSCHIFKDFDGG